MHFETREKVTTHNLELIRRLDVVRCSKCETQKASVDFHKIATEWAGHVPCAKKHGSDALKQKP